MAQKELSKAEIEALLKENKRLKLENASMVKILDSKRFRMAEKVANVYNAVFPDGSIRRKGLLIAAAPARIMSKYKNDKYIRKIEKKIGKNKKVLVIHSIPWNTPLRQRPHHLAKCLANHKDIFVVYFEPDEQLKNYREISNNFVTVNSWRIIFDIKHNPSNKYYFFFNNVSNVSFETVEKIKEKKYNIVYEYIDEFHEDISGSLMNQLETWQKLPKLKPYLILASAIKLYDEAKKHFKNTKVLLSRNAVNVEDFDYHNFVNVVAPNDLNKILDNRKPIVGYYGALAPWLDYKLISTVAKENPKYDFVLLGVNYQNALEKLDLSIKNIYYLGPKKYDLLPKYSKFFDCAIIPFKTGEIAKGTSPVKLFEYMAMGLPTVGTRDLNECKGYEYVYLAKNAEDFSKMIRLAIENHENKKVKDKLLEQAKDNSWQIRADEIIEELD